MSTQAEFWSRVDKTETCWLYRGYCLPNGYGRFQLKDAPDKYAHRASWIWANGAIPKGLGVLHRCDTPACVRPKHLFLGTQKENVADMFRKGRHRIKLAWWDLAHIRSMLDKGYLVTRVAKVFGVSRRTIWTIKTGLVWSRERTA